MTRVLVIGEHDGNQLRMVSRAALRFAETITEGDMDRVECLLLGSELSEAAQDAARFASVLCADCEALANPLADRYAKVIAEVAESRNPDFVVAASTTFSKDVVTRAAGLLGGAMASDVVGHEVVDGELQFLRPMYAGAVLATVRLNGRPKIITVRSSSYEPLEPASIPFEVTPVAVDETGLPTGMHFEGLDSRTSHRPDVTEAQVVVSGGRAIKNSNDFEQLVGGLADCMSGATGSSRALVDAGITPNELQIGQTGKIVAPEVYVALGISGAVQHLAGMKNSKTIFAINQDPDAPIFQFADYGLVGNVYEIVPQLINRLSRQSE